MEKYLVEWKSGEKRYFECERLIQIVNDFSKFGKNYIVYDAETKKQVLSTMEFKYGS